MIFGMDAFNYSPPINFDSKSVNDSSFSNTESWVKNAFKNHYNNCWGVNFGGYTIKTIHAISQRATPSSNQTTPNENTYQWDISYTWLGSDGSEGEDCQTFYYKTMGNYDYSGDKWNIPACKHYFNNGRAGSCLASGSGFTTLDEGETEADVFVLKTTYACPGQSTSKYHAKLYNNAKTGEWKIEKFPCDPWSSNSIGYKIYSDKQTAEADINTQWTDIWEESKEKGNDDGADDGLAKLEEDRLAKLEEDRLAQLALLGKGEVMNEVDKNLIPLIVGGGIILAIVVMIA